MQTCRRSKPDSTSSLVIASAVSVLSLTAYRSATRSSHPTRRERPVVVPYSPPRSRIASPSSPSISVELGPSSTSVPYAITTRQLLLVYFYNRTAPLHH